MADKRYTINGFTVNLDLESARDPELVVEHLLDLLASCDVRATVFADPAGIAPSLVRRIGESGHEVGMLSNGHPVRPGVIAGMRRRLQDACGGDVAGIRMGQFGLPGPPKSSAALLIAAGFTYSSSTFPPRTLIPNMIDTQFRAHRIHAASGFIWELPLTCWRPFGVGALQLPTSGGAGLAGLLPVWAVARGVQGMNYHGEPALLQANALSTGNRRVTARLEAIFGIYRFGSLAEAFASRLTTASTPASLHPGRTGIVRSLTLQVGA